MAVIPAVVTDKAREIWPKMLGGLLTFQEISYFRIAEGGWEDPGSGAVPRTPDAALLDVDVNENPSRYPADSLYYFQKSFDPSDLTFVGPTTLRCRCFLDFGDANDDGNGNSPEFWELGIFDAAGNMVAYGTFPQQTKNVAIQITDYVNIVF